ncbi:glutathione S-transferase family protein [Methylovulum psychrotolerans]|nr:glutathione S-transferase family protein [Methylovulum psychrotolerans]
MAFLLLNGADMYKLYDFLPSGNCYKIRLLLKQLGIAYERVDVDILSGQSRTDAFLQLNPNGRVPVLAHNGNYLPESNAILWYLAMNTAFLPTDAFAQAQVLQWLFFEQYSHEPNIATARYWISILKAKDHYAEPLKGKMEAGYAALDVMERHLQAKCFFVADQYSIADMALYAYTHVAEEGEFDLSAYRHIKAWFGRVQAQANHIGIQCA